MASSRVGNSEGSSGGGFGSAKPEEGDNIINWHLQYASAVALQANTALSSTADLIKAELAKIKSDFDFIKKLPGSHQNLMRLRATDRDLLNVLDNLKETADKLRAIAARSSQRII